MKVRENNRVVSRAVLVAIGVNEEGEREVLGVSVTEEEMESSWREFMRVWPRRFGRCSTRLASSMPGRPWAGRW